MNKNILVTGAAGFIGFHLCKRLIENGTRIIGIDNINDYYDIELKKKRLEILSQTSFKKNWIFIKTDLLDKDQLLQIFQDYKPETVINLAAQAGVRYSIENPRAYINSNILGFQNILDCCKESRIKHLLYASSSSVYGGNVNSSFSELDSVDHPVSVYAATKRANELFAHTYSHLYNIPATGMRFFTVYGPWGRPDMAPMIFANSIFSRKPIKVFNFGKMSRSFTYIDDVIDSIERLIQKPPSIDKKFDKKKPRPDSSWCPHRIFNIGNNESIKLEEFIYLLEKEIGKNAIKQYEDIKPGDVKETKSDNSILKEWIGDCPKTPLDQGINKFINWYKNFYNF
jgi:UDP-glucuronate 4-epimerase